MNAATITYTARKMDPSIVWAMRSGFAMNLLTQVDSLTYKIVAQDRNEMSSCNSPSVSMWPYLVHSAQTQKLNNISIYVDKGASREQGRLLYMNDTALGIWQEMGMNAHVVGESRRPPHSATLSFGMPFAE